MDYLFTPWRYAYITSADKKSHAGIPEKLSAWPGDHHCIPPSIHSDRRRR